MLVVSSFVKSLSTVIFFDTDSGFFPTGFIFKDTSLVSGIGVGSSGSSATVGSISFLVSSTTVISSADGFFDSTVNKSVVEDSTGVWSSLVSTVDLVVIFFLQPGFTSNSAISAAFFVTSIDVILVSMLVVSSFVKSLSTVIFFDTDSGFFPTGFIFKDTSLVSGIGVGSSGSSATVG